ncbi:hypothetical protein ScPMuIL_013918 [Solemya velum]
MGTSTWNLTLVFWLVLLGAAWTYAPKRCRHNYRWCLQKKEADICMWEKVKCYRIYCEQLRRKAKTMRKSLKSELACLVRVEIPADITNSMEIPADITNSVEIPADITNVDGFCSWSGTLGQVGIDTSQVGPSLLKSRGDGGLIETLEVERTFVEHEHYVASSGPYIGHCVTDHSKEYDVPTDAEFCVRKWI